MKKFLVSVFIFNICVTSYLVAQETGSGSAREKLFVFMDCNARNCDFDHFRREMPWVSWVQDRTQSDIHLLVTSQHTGSGGLQYTLDFIGRESFEGARESHVFNTNANDTDTEVRNQLTNMIALGLIQFARDIPDIISRLSINYQAPEETQTIDQQSDPWNLWVFELGLRGGIEGEAQQRGYSLDVFTNARRVAEDMKLELEVDGEYEYEEFDDLEEGQTFVNTSEDYRADLLAVWSLSPRSSVGGIAEFSKSTFVNRDFGLETGPAYEFNIFPYNESTRRLLTLQYAIGMAYYDYELETLEGKTNDRMGIHRLQLSAEIQQPWGEIDAFIGGIQYFAGHNFATTPHRINTFLRLEYRLFRGFEIDIFGFYSRIKDQFFLPAEGLTPEEILVRRRQRETDFRFDIGIGFSYRFGSKFANIVNPRMGMGP